MIFYLRENPDKGLEFGEMNMKDTWSPLEKSRLQVLVGVAELLKDDILEGKDFLVQSLQKGNEFDLINIAMNQNNLGVACWWDKYPNYSNILFESSEDDSEEEFSETAFRSKESDFSFSMSLFKMSITNFEKGFFYSQLDYINSENQVATPKSYQNLDKTLNLIDEVL